MLDRARHDRSRAAPFDVVVVGASLAGCTAARLFAQQGLTVALVEQHVALDWHKRLCTHYVQACAVETIDRLGLTERIEEAGGVRSRMEIWTRWGWIRHAGSSERQMYGYSIRRKTLDPIVRQLTVATPGVEFMPGWTAESILHEQNAPAGVALKSPSGATRNVNARLVVAADGRNSSLAKLAQVPVWTRPNHRFAYFAYYRNLPLASGNDSQFWMLDPDAAYALPNDEGITLLCCWLTKDKLEACRANREHFFEQFMGSLPDGPDLSRAERVSEVIGALDLPVELRGGAHGGIALVGDAALAADPLWGVGCGWAFQSAAWLVDCTAPALLSGGDLPRALRRYYKQHRWALGGHYAVIADYARGRPFSRMEKLYYSAAARDSKLAELLLGFGARRNGVRNLLSPAMLARAVWRQLRPIT